MLGATVYTFSIILAVFLVGLGDRQRGRLAAGARSARIPRLRARLLPDAAGRRGRLDRVHAVAIRCPTGRSIRCFPPAPGITFQIDMVRCLWAHPARHAALGRELSRWRWRPPRSSDGDAGAAGRRHLRREHRRRDPGRAQLQPDLVPWIGTQGARARADRRWRPSARSSMLVPLVGRPSRSMPGAAGLAARRWCWPACLVAHRRRVPGMLIAYGRRMMTSHEPLRDPLHGRGHQLLDRDLPSGTTAPSSSTSAARWRRPPSPTTCACSACSATCRRCAIRIRNRC